MSLQLGVTFIVTLEPLEFQANAQFAHHFVQQNNVQILSFCTTNRKFIWLKEPAKPVIQALSLYLLPEVHQLSPNTNFAGAF